MLIPAALIASLAIIYFKTFTEQQVQKQKYYQIENLPLNKEGEVKARKTTKKVHLLDFLMLKDKIRAAAKSSNLRLHHSSEPCEVSLV